MADVDIRRGHKAAVLDAQLRQLQQQLQRISEQLAMLQAKVE